MFDPVPNLPDDTPIDTVRFSTIIRNGLLLAGLKTIREARAMADNDLRRCIGLGRLDYLGRTLSVTSAKAK